MPHECGYNWTHTFTERGRGAKEWHCPVAPCMLLAPGGFLVPLQLLSVEQEEEEEMMVNTVDSLSMESESSSVQYPPNERRGIQGHKEDVFAPDLAAVPLPQCSPLPCPPLASFVWRLHKHPLYLAHLPPSLSLALCIACLWVFPLTLSCLALFSSSTRFTQRSLRWFIFSQVFVSLPLCLHLLLSSPRLIFFSKAIYLHPSPLPPLVNLSLSLFFLHISLLFAWIISSSKPPLPRFLSSLLCCGSVRSLSDFNDLSTWVQSVTLIKLCHFHLFLSSIRPLVLLTLLYRKGISPCLLMTLPSVAFRLSFHFPLHLNYFT